MGGGGMDWNEVTRMVTRDKIKEWIRLYFAAIVEDEENLWHAVLGIKRLNQEEQGGYADRLSESISKFKTHSGFRKKSQSHDQQQ